MSDDKITTKATFGTYGKSFQEKIVQALLSDRVWAEQMLEVFNVEYLELKYLQFLADRYFGYAKKYKVFPTLTLLITIIRDELKVGTDAIIRDQIIDYLQRMRANPDPGDLQYVKDKALDFCRKQALKAALTDAVDQIQAEKYESIVENIKKAVMVGTAPQLGHDFFIDYESRFTALQRNAIETGLGELDKKEILNGGLGAGEIGVIVAPTGVGKCFSKFEILNIKYVAIKINDKNYRPWDIVNTCSGLKYARDVVETDLFENYSNFGKLSITHYDIIEQIQANKLFEQIGFSCETESTDESGDSYISNQWPIEVESLDAFYPIDGFRWTKPEQQVRLYHNDLISTTQNRIAFLTCSPDHIVLRQNKRPEWVKVRDLVYGDLIVCKNGIRKVEKIQLINDVERLCDLQVSIAHSYYSGNVLSHNSHFLTFLGTSALRKNIDVLHYTFELSESAVGRRYDSNLCDIDSNQVIENKEKVIAQYQNMKLGRLIIKEFPTNTASIYTLRNHIERLDVKGFKPGLIIIDYADIMRSTRQYDSLRHELKLIYEELRGFAGEKLIPIWTASQSNKEGSNSDIVDLGNMSEAYGKAMVADVVLSISRRAHEKSTGFGRLYVAKNRAGRDGIVYPVKIDTAKSNFEIIGTAGSLEGAVKQDEDEVKRALRLKWKELRNDPVLGEKLKNHENGIIESSDN